MTQNPDFQYLELINKIMADGVYSGDRTGTGTKRIAGYQMRFDLTNNKVPLLNIRRVPVKTTIRELLWFLSGDTNSKTLECQKVKIWREWGLSKEAAERSGLPEGSLGPVYGALWRRMPAHADWDWMRSVLDDDSLDHMTKIEMMRNYVNESADYVDQIAVMLSKLKQAPESRRVIVNGWNSSLLPEEGVDHDTNIINGKPVLPPCHTMFQMLAMPIENPVEGGPRHRLTCLMVQRSADVILGLPVNIASYAILTHMVAQVVGMEAGELVISIHDAHIYMNHMDTVDELRDRAYKSMRVDNSLYGKPPAYIQFNQQVTGLLDFTEHDMLITGYDPLPGIKAEIAV